MNALILVLIAAFSGSGPVRGPQDSGLPRLSTEGRAAYEQVVSADVFAIGPVGFAASTSAQEKALRTLLAERNAREAMASLARSTSAVGRLYGIAGLSALDRNRASDLARKLARERGADEVQQMSGCVISPIKVSELCARIEQGDFAEQLGRPVRGR